MPGDTDEDENDAEEEYQDDEEEHDEEEFVPGADEDEEDDSPTPVNAIRCAMTMESPDSDGQRRFQLTGEGMRLSGTWVISGTTSLSGTMEPGTGSSPRKAPPRTMEATITEQRAKDSDPQYQLTAQDHQFQIRTGLFVAPTGGGDDSITVTVVWERLTATASPAVAAAAARPALDEDDEEPDEGVDHNELLALHEEARLPVQTVLQQTYEGEPPTKRARQDDDDDDDAEF